MSCKELLGESQIYPASLEPMFFWPDAGVEVKTFETEDSPGPMVNAVIIHYKATDKKPFNGGDANGISATSTPDDVIKAYGPGEETDSVVPATGEFPGAKQHTITYKTKGIYFTWYDGALSIVAMYAPQS